MAKTYASYADEITSDELYKGLLAHGLFSEKLPPVFESESFYHYTVSKKVAFSHQSHRPIYFQSMREINIPRMISVPNPMAYQMLCKVLSDNWSKICLHFHKQTDGDAYKISRIHIRKRKNTEALFEMNYQNWRIDGSPIPDIAIGKKFRVKADISTCFPSIYTHSIPWALMGKSYAKQSRNAKNMWENELDEKCRKINYDETTGLPIGPHTSNILSEIILTVIDKNLYEKNWKFIRNIDDYECYTESYDKAQEFLVDLATELKEFNLTINYKKANIEKLPIAATTHWVRQLNAVNYLAHYGGVSYNSARAYIDAAIQLMEDNGGNAAVIKYAIKVLADKADNRFSENAKVLCAKTFLHLAAIYSYLIPMLDQYVFEPFKADKSEICNFSQTILKDALASNNCEAVAYAIFFAIKYNFTLVDLSAKDVIDKKDCILSVIALLYYRKIGAAAEEKEMTGYAMQLNQNMESFDENWLFVFEALDQSQFNNEWANMKKNGISFIRSEYRF